MSDAIQKILCQPLRVIKVEQQSTKWMELRRNYRTASETPIVLGISPWSTPAKLAMEKFSSKPVEFTESFATAHGHQYEPVAREFYEKEHGRSMPPTVLVRGDYMASLDGFSRDRKVVLEIKCPFSGVYGSLWEDALDGKVPEHYEMQIAHQLMVSGSPICHLWVYLGKSRKGIMIEVKREPKHFPVIHQAWEDFFKKYG